MEEGEEVLEEKKERIEEVELVEEPLAPTTVEAAEL